MQTINLKINTHGNIICTYEKNNKIKYINYKTIIDEIDILSKRKDKKLSIINNTIKFTNKDILVTIENYDFNKDKFLYYIIDRLKAEKLRKRREELRKKRVKRQKMISTSILLSAITLTSLATGHSLVKALSLKELPQEPSYYLAQTIEKKDSPILIGSEEIVFEKDISREETIVEENSLEEDNKKRIEIDFLDRTDTEKFKVAKSYYKDIITRISNTYGVDPQIMLAIATQERGKHIIDTNTPAIGLMQLEKSVWVGSDLTAYNYDLGKNETVHITEEKLKDLEFNIKVACMHFQDCLKKSKYNLPIAIQMYNFGYGNMNDTLNIAYNGTINLENIEYLNDIEWMNYRTYINQGDDLYLEHILSYIEDLDNIHVQIKDEKIIYSISSILESKHMI